MQNHYRDAIFVCSSARNLTVALWLDAPQVQHMAALRRSNEQLSERYPEGIGLLNVVLRGTPNFSEEVRRETAGLIKSAERYSVAAAHVLFVPGLVGVAVRTFISTVLLVARPSTPTKVFGEAEPAAAWLAPLLSVGGERWQPRDIIDLCDEARALGG